ncbi:hypothetical protein PFICI_10959 [Pestalotiopsis fici W106-1]|uniref:Glucose-methanol-choline oxidoreductase N-terminal domain-containing protein n=1 Tax=Pestalotiopsis fici (strain W106-1 / CGMCC3.15140) TaxID=1229662 RepID=W3WTA7_PESFW|nr:uncharacterized protein PFICI_10959 [Pestalotiopsis fici W106-1]ETS77085.1 hypothetical protein PFICI_10959 [Pestalotiopsis fici W106-1]
MTSTFDFVILGGGTAGLVVASRLSENPGHRVLVLEAGSDLSDDPRVKTPAFYATLMKSDANWGFKSEPQPTLNGREIGLHQGRALGGSSAINGQAFVPPGKHTIDAWEKAGNPGWNWQELERYYARSHTLPGVTQRTKGERDGERDFHGPLQVSLSTNLSHPIHKVWNETFQAKGHYVSAEPWLGQPVGAFSSLATVDPSRKERSYATTAYYNPIKDRNNLQLLTNAVVERIIFETQGSATRAIGAQYTHNGKTETVTAAKEVILAAGALQSPKLLELSGVGNAEILRRNNIPLVVELPGVGENLQDHIVCPISVQAIDGLETMDPLARQEPEAIGQAMQEYATHRTGLLTSPGTATYAYMPTTTELSRDSAGALKELLDQNQPVPSNNGHGGIGADLHDFVGKVLTDPTMPSGAYLSVLSQAGKSPVPGTWLTLVAYLPHPLSLGSVHIRSRLASETPVIDPKYFSHPVDIEVLAHEMRYLQSFATSSPFNKLLREPLHYLDPTTDFSNMEATKDYIRSNAVSMWHYAGTCAMLPKEKGGVVDTRLRVHGIDNLRIVDSSIIPIVTTGNLQSTVYAIAEKAADLIKRDYREV